MGDIKIKICGMREPDNVQEIASLCPKFIGLIFYPNSPRFISPEQASLLPDFSSIKRIGVFVNESVTNIIKIAARTRLSAVQLHGSETPETCDEIRQRNPDLQIIKAFAVGENFDHAELTLYEDICDFFLFDTKGVSFGGTGQTFDWQVLSKGSINKPFFLSGGIGIDNIIGAISACKNLPLFAIDLNSRVELAPGLKSPEIVANIMNCIASQRTTDK